MAQPTVAAGADQCRQFLKGLRPKSENREIWIKSGHDSIYRAEWDEEGNLSGILTSCLTKDDPFSRQPKGKPIPNLIEYLEVRAKKETGGVFYIPTQPIGLPIASAVSETDDIGVEMDHLSLDDQKTLIAEFCEVTGLEFASVLTSGGNSVHAHLKLAEHLPIEQAGYWRRLAIIAFQSDPVTERLHQPMRLPGFFRKEKNSYQELLSLSDRRYTEDELRIGFSQWFEHKGWALTYTISDQWWKEVWFPLLRGENKATPQLKASQTVIFLTEGDAAYTKRRAVESAARAAERLPVPNISGQQISDVVGQVCDRAQTGDFSGVDWQGSGGHYRGQCPFHQGKTGNSAWLSDKDGGLRFHCVSCTNDGPRSSFEYWIAQSGLAAIESPSLTGRDYAKAAEVFLGQYGLTLPKPIKPETNGHSNKAIAGQSAGGEESKGEFLPDPGFDRPKIEVKAGALKSTRETIIGYLAKETNPVDQIYVQGNGEQWLTRILTTNNKVDCCQKLDADKITQAFDDRFAFFQTKKTQKGETSVSIDCPVSIAKNFYNASRWDPLPKLTGIIKLPVLKMDGTVCMGKGYDSGTGYLMDFDEKEFCLKEKPNKKDAIEALKILKDLISESSFEDDRSRSGALSMLLTAASRNSYDYAPLHAISANTPGAGKGTLTQLATIFATGKPNEGMTTFNPEETELKKSLVSAFMKGSSVISFDNISRSHVFGGAEIEMALTNLIYSGRILGGNEMGAFSTKVLWLANGNKLNLTLDMGRRTILIVLDSKEENAFEKEYQRDLIPYAIKNRGKLVSAALTILQAFLLEKPLIQVRPLNSFVQWSNVVRNALIWLGEADPAPNSKSIYELDGIDEERAGLAYLLDIWLELYGKTSVTAREVVNRAIGSNGNERLRTALTEVALDKKGQLTSNSLGKYLRSHAGVRIGNMRFIKAGIADKHQNVVQWQIEVFPCGDDLIPAASPQSSPQPESVDTITSSSSLRGCGDKIEVYAYGEKDNVTNNTKEEINKNPIELYGGFYPRIPATIPASVTQEGFQTCGDVAGMLRGQNVPARGQKYMVAGINLIGLCQRVDLEESKAEISFLENDETDLVSDWFLFDDLELVSNRP
ncbi:MAG: hypothetical protein ACRC62_37780 [Microcoleus sp.]